MCSTLGCAGILIIIYMTIFRITVVALDELLKIQDSWNDSGF